MIELRSVSKPLDDSPAIGSEDSAAPAARRLEGSAGTQGGERSREFDRLVAKGRGPSMLSPLETVIGADDRQRILETHLSPWNMICALRMRGAGGGGAIGTGWLIGPRTLLTAGHCVYSSTFFGGWASRVEVIPGMNGAGDGPEARPFGSVVSERFSSVNRWTDGEDADFDFGCIHLDEAIGDRLGWFSTAALVDDELEGFLVNVSGYPADRGKGAEQYHSANRILRVSDRRIFYEVDTFGGQSGAPVWIHRTDDGPPVAVAIHAYGTGGTPGSWDIAANSAPRIIPEVLAQLRGWIDADGAGGGGG